MTGNRNINQQRIGTILIIITIFILVITAPAALGHGGKHSETFTNLQAFQKATQLYDKLINTGKLDPSWETDLKKVTVSYRQKGDKKEIVVVFYRGEGEPPVVYIFFDASGKYTGSNFTGK